FVAEALHLGDDALRLLLSFAIELRIWKKQRSLEMTEEQPLGKAELLRTGEQEFLGLLFLLFDLCRGQCHAGTPEEGVLFLNSMLASGKPAAQAAGLAWFTHGFRPRCINEFHNSIEIRSLFRHFSRRSEGNRLPKQ